MSHISIDKLSYEIRLKKILCKDEQFYDYAK